MEKNEVLPVRLLVAVSESVLRRGLMACLADADDIDVIGGAATSREALEIAGNNEPHLAILSSSMDKADLAHVCGALRRLDAHCQTLLLATEEKREIVLAGAQAGVRGILSIANSEKDIIAAIHVVHGGRMCFSDTALRYIVEDYEVVSARTSAKVTPTKLPPGQPSEQKRKSEDASLTGREKQVLALVSSGMTSREIASELQISTRTVEAHRARVCDKLGIRTVAGLTRYALKMGVMSGV